jgi:hypothetical protein
MNNTQKPIKIDKDIVKAGIMSGGIKFAKNLDIFNFDGVAKANLGMYNTLPEQVVTTFTANTSTDLITVANTLKNFTFAGRINPNTTGRAVTLTTTGTLPAPLTPGTVYFVSDNGNSQTTLYLSTTLLNAINGVTIDITTTGTGTHTMTTVPHSWFTHYAENPITGEIYAQDHNNRVWIYLDATYSWGLIPGNTLTNGTGNGLVVWKNYLIAFRNTQADVYGPLNGTPSWTNSWSGASGLVGGSHTCFKSQNDRVYIINNDNLNNVPYIASLRENTPPFNPSVANSYVWNAQALDLPQYETITCINEHNDLLMIGSASGKIYPWDKISDSFRTPIPGIDNYVYSMININNYLYFGAGNKGNIYRTLGTTVDIVVDFSDDLSNYPENTASCIDLAQYPGGMLALLRQSGNQTDVVQGVYFIDINNGNRYSLFNTVSNDYGNFFQIPVKMFSKGTNYQYFVSWAGIGLYGGCDTQKSFGFGPYRQTGDIAQYITELFRVSDDSNNPRTFETVEIFLKKKIVSGQSVKVAFRTNETDAFSQDIEFNFSNMAQGNHITGWAKINIHKAHFLQIRVTISIPTHPSSSFSYSTPEIEEIRVV